ncbi:MAG TPA: hypothetical protein PLW80_03360, partial [Spirochaetales bacterium]|nr:hypothetical protein [Spirochaetales bacterium]
VIIPGFASHVAQATLFKAIPCDAAPKGAVGFERGANALKNAMERAGGRCKRETGGANGS